MCSICASLLASTQIFASALYCGSNIIVFANVLKNVCRVFNVFNDFFGGERFFIYGLKSAFSKDTRLSLYCGNNITASWSKSVEHHKMFHSRGTQDAFCSANCSSAVGSDLRAIDWTAQSDLADLVRHIGMSAAESWQPVWGEWYVCTLHCRCSCQLMLAVDGYMRWDLLWFYTRSGW